MPMFTIMAYERWRKVLDRVRPPRPTEHEQDEARCLEAMQHWRDPEERLRTLSCRCSRHALIDDNPVSS
jgi:hypothetical protein